MRRSKGSPEPVRTDTTGSSCACAAPVHIASRFIAGFNGIGNEDHGTVTYQDMRAALMATAGAVDAIVKVLLPLLQTGPLGGEMIVIPVLTANPFIHL